VLGFVLGVGIVLTPSTAREAPLWVVWASLAVSLTSAAGAVFGYGVARWAELCALRPVAVRDVAAPVAALTTVAVLAALTSIVLTVTAHRSGAGWSAVRGWGLTLNRGQRLCDDLFPLPEADEAPAILNRAEDRSKLGQLLGMDRSVVADLQTGLAILGPLIASAAAAFLPQ
jgi:hypothetical protein